MTDMNSQIPDQLEVYDEADQASMIQLAEQARAMEQIRARNMPEEHPDFDGHSCIECGDEIPQARLDLGKIRCVHCQSALEKRGKMYAKKED